MEIVKTDISLPKIYGEKHNLLAFTLDNVLSVEECQELIKVTEEAGYELALINTGGGRQGLRPDVRNSQRCIIDSHDKAAFIWDRIKSYVPKSWKSHPVHSMRNRGGRRHNYLNLPISAQKLITNITRKDFWYLITSSLSSRTISSFWTFYHLSEITNHQWNFLLTDLRIFLIYENKSEKGGNYYLCFI